MKHPLVSFVIIALNEEKNIGKLIKSIKNNTYKEVEIVVVDGGSKDKTVQIARKMGARIIKEIGNKGPGNAKNQGVSAAKGKIVIRIDADLKGINKKFIENIVKRFSENGVIAVAPRKHEALSTFWEKSIYENRQLTHFIFNAIRGRFQTIDKKTESWYLYPIAMLRKTFFEVGGYDNVGFEDRLFLKKFDKYCKENSVKCVHESKSIMYMSHPQTLDEILKQYEWYSRGAIQYFQLTGDKKEFLLFLILLSQPLLIASVFMINFHILFKVLSALYLIKIIFLTLYFVIYRKFHVVVTPILDFFGGVWKYYGLIRLAKMKIKKSDRIYSRG
ncbi:MAG: glycosyltransferase family 2 protein [Candidatus Aenigmarchaeota archaeon]|nr:glycosyltransferase family 2 protein [Candidatus Aenigmarchaeota archaeon]